MNGARPEKLGDGDAKNLGYDDALTRGLAGSAAAIGNSSSSGSPSSVAGLAAAGSSGEGVSGGGGASSAASGGLAGGAGAAAFGGGLGAGGSGRTGDVIDLKALSGVDLSGNTDASAAISGAAAFGIQSSANGSITGGRGRGAAGDSASVDEFDRLLLSNRASGAARELASSDDLTPASEAIALARQHNGGAGSAVELLHAVLKHLEKYKTLWFWMLLLLAAVLRRHKNVALGLVVLSTAVWFVELPKPSVEWFDAERSAYTEAHRLQAPMIVDFRADWCAPCLEIEAMMKDPIVAEPLARFVKLKMDVTGNTERDRNTMKCWGIEHPPALFFVDSSGKIVQELTIRGMPSKEQLLRALAAVR